jgi:predicted outer membrane repeat protein
LNVEVTSSTLSNNRANENGGVIYAVHNIAIINSTFSNNTANTGNGGTLYSGNDVTVTNCTISESSAAVKGGASAGESITYIFNPNIVLSNSTFRSNYATSGGVLYTTGYYHHHVKFIDSTFVLNEAVSGGVAHVENSSLSITECLFDNNEATEDGGVLNMIFSSVSIRDTSLSQNNARNGGVFYGKNYSTNFTIEHTVIDHNSAGNGGVFYVRRSNSNIKIFDSKFIDNSAGNQGGVMDIRGVTLIMDMDTIIANNTAGSSGNVISACVSQITAYGLEARLDPVYPQYCLIYDEGNSSIPHPMSQTISTDDSTTMFTTEQTLMETTSHDGDTEQVTTTVSERGTTNKEMATMTQASSPTSQSTSFTSDSPGASHTHSPYEATSQLPSDNDISTTESNTQPPAMIASTKIQSHTDEVTTISVDVTTPGSVTQETSSSPIVSTAHDGHEGSTTTPVQIGTTTATPTTVSSETDRPTYFSGSMDSSVTTDPDRLAVLQGEEDKYNDVWKSSQHSQLQVSIISLMVLCMVCTAVCVMMVTLFFVACKRRGGPRLVTRARYKKLSPTDKDLETKRENEIEEYSFSEI